MNVCLIANYLPDGQQSMLRFADLLARELPRRGVTVEVIRPEPTFNFRHGRSGTDKYLGYIDKLVLFRNKLRCWVSEHRDSVVHICDHSNAFYTHDLRNVPHLVTCHDLLAVRSALGEFRNNATRWSGRRLQSKIVRGLNSAQHVACVSEATRQDVLRLTSLAPDQVDVVYNGLNYPYAPMPISEADALLSRLGVRAPFILHVGGDHWYKNRRGVLEIYAALRARLADAPSLVIAGDPLSTKHRDFLEASGLSRQVTVVSNVANEELRALYSSAELLLFPSLVEGFGWPIIEAQACGCPVVTTNRPPMTEIGGTAATYIDPADLPGSTQPIELLLREAPNARCERISASLANAGRFSTEQMIAGYARIYERLAANARLERYGITSPRRPPRVFRDESTPACSRNAML